MGVPALFRWLSKKYPKIVEQVREDLPNKGKGAGGLDGSTLDMSKRNPNGVEFDNMYLDMNGIVHPCTHPEGKEAPKTEEEMMIEVFKYTERVVHMVRPRKLLMIAIDGVAPRAKMNQQRSRRFRAAQEAKTKEEEKLAAILEWETMGVELTEEYKSNTRPWDSNAITPGTPFMTLLADSLRYWIVQKMNTDPGWRKMQVILSDASVPGEGEHKIMDFIRRQRTQPDYDPNTSHVIYGLDADLIMLSLATHEPNFKVLREDVFANDKKKGRGCHKCGIVGHHSSQCYADKFVPKEVTEERKPFIFLDVSTLRRYLAVELNLPNLSFTFDLERAIDDWVLLIFFVGNDFLPHLPSLEIREGAIDTLLNIWKTNLAKMGGYLTDCGKLNLERTEIILKGLGSREDAIFRKRQEAEEHQDRDGKRRRFQGDQDNRSAAPPPGSIPGLIPLKPGQSMPPMNPPNELVNFFSIEGGNGGPEAMLDDQLNGQLENLTLEPSAYDPSDEDEVLEPAMPHIGPSKPAPLKMLGNNMVDQEDTVRLWEPGYRERYYQQKFGIELSNETEKRKIVQCYVEGLAWVLAYYYQGCQSWQWYYPYHYSPFAADFTNLKDLKIEFNLGKPFTPFEQLMGVFPASSRWHIPTAFHELMTSDKSPIKHFYPEEFEIDMNGKKMLWQGIALLPFIEQDQLLDSMKLCEHLLTDADKLRIKAGNVVIFCGEGHPQYENLCQLYRKQTTKAMRLNPHTAKGVFGAVLPDPKCIPGSTFHSPLPGVGLPDISNVKSIFANFFLPAQVVPHRSVLLKAPKSGKRVLVNHNRNPTAEAGNSRPPNGEFLPYLPPHPSVLPHPKVLRNGQMTVTRILNHPSREDTARPGNLINGGSKTTHGNSFHPRSHGFNGNSGPSTNFVDRKPHHSSRGGGQSSQYAPHRDFGAHPAPNHDSPATSYHAVPPPTVYNQSRFSGRGRGGRGAFGSHAASGQYGVPTSSDRGGHAPRGSQHAPSSASSQGRVRAVQPPRPIGGAGYGAVLAPAYGVSDHDGLGVGPTPRLVSYEGPAAWSGRGKPAYRASAHFNSVVRSGIDQPDNPQPKGHGEQAGRGRGGRGRR